MAHVTTHNDVTVLHHGNLHVAVPPGWIDFAMQLAAEHALGHVKETAMQRLVAMMPGATSGHELKVLPYPVPETFF